MENEGKKNKHLSPQSAQQSNVQCKLCLINRSTKVTTGGRRFRFSAVVLAGDMKDKVGWGVAKARSISDVIKRAEKKAIANMIETPKVNGTITCVSEGIRDSVKVIVKPAREGTGIVAGAIPSLIFQMGGYSDIVSKNIRGSNRMNQIIAIFAALEQATRSEIIRKARVGGIQKQSGK